MLRDPDHPASGGAHHHHHRPQHGGGGAQAGGEGGGGGGGEQGDPRGGGPPAERREPVRPGGEDLPAGPGQHPLLLGVGRGEADEDHGDGLRPRLPLRDTDFR